MNGPDLGLRAITGTVTTESLDLLTYQRDCSVIRPGRAEAMVRPASRADVAAVLKSASQRGTPVYVRGAGTMYAGGVNPHAGGIVLDMTGLDRILEIDLERGVVIVEPGVRFGLLSAALQAHGMTIGIIPSTSPTATIGGAAAAHALGTGSARFQSFADEVVGLEVVLADGRVLRTGSAAAGEVGFFHRFGMGPDLTGLFLGGDATFGVITAIALWLHPLPAYRTTACYGFPSHTDAAQFIAALQLRELTRNVWYASGYEGISVKGRVLAAYPSTPPDAVPQFCVGVDYGGDEVCVRHDEALIEALCVAHRGALYPVFDEVYFRHLRQEEIYW
jgi:FAD/FMN-containing dehydrogenase